MSPPTHPLMLGYTAQACISCNRIHPAYLNPVIATCICETAIFCNAACRDAAHHNRDCRAIRDILNAPTFRPMRCIPPSDNHAEISTRRLQWRNRILTANHLASGIFGAGLAPSFGVANRFSMEPFCGVCYATMRNGAQGPCIKSCCNKCYMAFACHFHEAHVKNMHTAQECQNYCVLHDTQDWLREYAEKHRAEFTFIPDGTLGNKPKRDDWASFFAARTTCATRSTIMGEAALMVAVTRVLTTHMTTLLALKEFNRRIRKRLVIHVAGASAHDGMPSPAWEEVMHQHPSIKELYVVLIGPDLNTMINHTARDTDFLAAVCEKCARRRRVYRIVGGLYHDFARTRAYSKPDIVMAFNPGLSHEDRYTWEPTLRYLVESGIPTCLTSFTRYEAAADQNIVTGLGGKLWSAFKANPYRSLEPMVDPDVMAIDKFFFLNQFYMLMKGRR